MTRAEASSAGGHSAADRAPPPPRREHPGPGLRSAAAAFGWKKLALLFMLVFVIHCVSPSVQVTDSRLSVFTAYSVYRHGTLDLSGLPPPARSQLGADDYDIVKRDDALLPFYPYGPMVMLTPAVAAADLAGLDPAGMRLIGPNETWKIEVPSASLLVALATLAMALIGYALTKGPDRLRVRVGLATALFFGFGTAAWSTAHGRSRSRRRRCSSWPSPS